MSKAVVRSRRVSRAKEDSYHHGNLRDALIDVAIELIESGGVERFSLAEACRRLDVTVAAPYRHFADRDDLLTAVAVRGCEILGATLSSLGQQSADPVERLVGAARAYVQFAAQHPALFEVLYTKEVFVGRNPKLASAVRPLVDAFVLPAFELPGVTHQQAMRVVLGAAAAAHGYAAFLRAGSFSDEPDPIGIAAENAACATRAIVHGRDALIDAPAGPGVVLAGLTIENWVDSAVKVDESSAAG